MSLLNVASLCCVVLCRQLSTLIHCVLVTVPMINIGKQPGDWSISDDCSSSSAISYIISSVKAAYNYQHHACPHTQRHTDTNN